MRLPKLPQSPKISQMLPRLAVPGLVASVGSYQAYKDYKHAPQENKKMVLLKDIILLGATGAGALSAYKFAERNLSKIKNEALREYLDNLSVPLGGIVTGTIAGQIVEKTLPSKPVEINEDAKKQINLLADFDYGCLGKAYGYAGLGVGGALDATFSTLSGFNTGKEPGVKNKIRRATYEIIAGVLIPVAIMVPIAKWLKDQPLPKKVVSLLPIVVGSWFLSKAVGDWFNKKVTDKLVQKELWEHVSKRQQELIKYSLVAMKTKDVKARKQILEDLHKLREIKQNIESLNAVDGKVVKS